METSIVITGPGGCINRELDTIKEALEVRGFSVEVKNSYPDKEPFDYSRPIKWGKVVISMDHRPWGG